MSRGFHCVIDALQRQRGRRSTDHPPIVLVVPEAITLLQLQTLRGRYTVGVQQQGEQVKSEYRIIVSRKKGERRFFF